MGKSYAEYLKTVEVMPETDPEAEEFRARVRTDRERKELSDKLKAELLQGLTEGDYPENLLLLAVECIGILSDDDEYNQTCRQLLLSQYKDVAQLSLLRKHLDEAEAEVMKTRDELIEKKLKRIRKERNEMKEAAEKLTAWEAALMNWGKAGTEENPL